MSRRHGSIPSNEQWPNTAPPGGVWPSGSGGTELEWISVKDAAYGALGNGSNDDTAEIQAAFDAVPAAGGVVYFPPGDYRVSAPLVPKSFTTIIGSEAAHSYWTYNTSTTAPSFCKIRALSGHSGTAILNVGTSQKVGISNITIDGGWVGTPGTTTGIPGIVFASAGIPHYFTAQNLAIYRCTGDGVKGRLHVGSWHNLFIGGCGGWGINQNLSWTDVHFVTGYISGCVTGAFNSDTGTTSTSGEQRFTSFRFERSGWNSAAVSTPTNSNAIGLRLRTLVNSGFVNCSTDANSGVGLDIENGGTQGNIFNLKFSGFTFRRDGYGDMNTDPQRPGVRLVGTSGAKIQQVTFTGCEVTTGRAVDGSGTTPPYTHPYYGVQMEWTTGCDWRGGGRVTSSSGTNWYYGASANTTHFKMGRVDADNDLLSVPRTTSGSYTRPPFAMGSNSNGTVDMIYDGALFRAMFNDGGDWFDADGNRVTSNTITTGTITLTQASKKIQRIVNNLTTNMSIVLPTTGTDPLMYEGMSFLIVRSGLGQYRVDVGGLLSLPPRLATWCKVVYTGSSWQVAAFGYLNNSRERVSSITATTRTVILTENSDPVQRIVNTLTGNMAITLPTSGTDPNIHEGMYFDIVRSGLGAFTVDVGGLKTINSGVAATVTVEYTGSSWFLKRYSTL